MLIATYIGPSADQGIMGISNRFDRVLSITLTKNNMGRPAVERVHRMLMEQKV